jgi:hypothetical protein
LAISRSCAITLSVCFTRTMSSSSKSHASPPPLSPLASVSPSKSFRYVFPPALVAESCAWSGAPVAAAVAAPPGSKRCPSTIASPHAVTTLPPPLPCGLPPSPLPPLSPPVL